MRHPIRGLIISLGLVLSLASPALARPQAPPSGYRLEEQFSSLSGTAASRRLLSRRETEHRTLERQVIEQPSINGGSTVHLEVEEETVRVDSRTTRRTRREIGPGANGRKSLIRTVEEVRVEGPGGRLRIVRSTSQPDLNGRTRTTRREVAETVPEGRGNYRTEIVTSVPDINSRGLAPVIRIEQSERRDGEKTLEVERTTHSRSVGNGRWETTERRTTSREYGHREVRTVEQVYQLDGNHKLTLSDRIVTREWTDARGAEHLTQEVHSRNIPVLARSNSLGLYQQIEEVRTQRPDGSRQATRELRERGMNGIRLIERVIEESRPTRDGTTTVRTVQGADGNGRLRTVSVTRSNESGS